MGQHRRILQVVGYQNSGKTTLVESLIRECSERGMRVATIKHHGHPTAQKQESHLKDSERHLAAGADITAVEGGGSLQIHIRNQTWSLDKLLQLYEPFPIDLILVEGFKHEHFPKVVLLRGPDDRELLSTLKNITCAIRWENFSLPEQRFPLYDIEDSASYIQYILQKLSDDDESAF
ncbi:molybdopterin-guanine dinucleotide biosynthesis protein B [Alkalihalobacillus sp. MEB130]|uniref:molybdopterin-guanine dinucleotide biosynthesis protein B n=1 Tax=Alkalihalobacillus sp. MEB130 TaxID=2976704 RepID=UPI0028DF3C20|nr:molybdopterin-guanine dinucleotide biosynthesis protein B [Alkalihalobacillus sp. MEB130]MDT8862383.1 molybdopterin-guanine dinucleotide biosynthesis protein B [Alkalihalobacillus sp. MEB130]